MHKIGINISTCDRPEYLNKLLESIRDCEHIVCICDDGHDKVDTSDYKKFNKIDSEEPRSGVAKNKNNGLKYLLDKQCDYIFSLEDDCTISDLRVFDLYIEACNATGIQHFNYGPGSPWNRKQDDPSIIGNLSRRTEASQLGEPMPRMIVQYTENISISLYQHVVGMFSFFSKKCLDTVGIMDERFYNAWEHVDHTLQTIKNNMHPPFWFFADIVNSHEFIHEQLNEKANTSLSKSEDEFNDLVIKGAEQFRIKNDTFPGKIPDTDTVTVRESLKTIFKQHSV